MSKRPLFFFVCLCLLIASFFRFTGVNWDANQHLHPDERFLTMVADGMKWPGSLAGYLDTDHSLLNPHNIGNGFYVYGTFPVIFTKWVAELFHMGDYYGITLVGRVLSGLVDLGTVLLVFFIAHYIQTGQKQQERGSLPAQFPLLAMFLYATCVLPIQLSHFFAVDTYLTFFITASLLALSRLLVYPRSYLSSSLLLGISFGLAIAAKISALYFLPIIACGFFFFILKDRHLGRILGAGILFCILAVLTVRLAYPYLFQSPSLLPYPLNAKVLENWEQLKSFDDINGGFPPGVQWITTKAYAFPLKNLLFWGTGLPLGLLALVSVGYLVFRMMYLVYKKKKYRYHIQDTRYQILGLCFLWVVILFGYQGMQFAKTMRYFYPFYPAMIIIAAYGYYGLASWVKKRNPWIVPMSRNLTILIIMLLSVYPLAFVTIYLRPHSRIQASAWIYDHIPAGAVLSAEHWDDALPISFPDGERLHERYPHEEFPLYWPDNEEKWQKMSAALQTVDYVVITSNRLFGSLMTVPEKFPVTNRYYHALFDGSLGFEKVAEFTSRPNLPIPIGNWCLTPPFIRYGIVAYPSQECPLPGISFVDDYADEMFTVYDHPKVLIFKKVRPVDYYQMLWQPATASLTTNITAPSQ